MLPPFGHGAKHKQLAKSEREKKRDKRESCQDHWNECFHSLEEHGEEQRGNDSLHMSIIGRVARDESQTCGELILKVWIEL